MQILEKFLYLERIDAFRILGRLFVTYEEREICMPRMYI